MFKKSFTVGIVTLCFIFLLLQPAYALGGNVGVYDFSQTPQIPSNALTIASYFNFVGFSATSYYNSNASSVRSSLYGQKIAHINGHGGPGVITCGYNGATKIKATGTSDSTYYSLSDTYGGTGLPTTKFIFFDGCSTSQYSSTYGDLDNYCYYSLGVDSTLAYSSSVYFTTGNPNVGCALFSKQFFSYSLLSTIKKTIDNSVVEARSDVFLTDGWTCGTENAVTFGGSGYIYYY